MGEINDGTPSYIRRFASFLSLLFAILFLTFLIALFFNCNLPTVFVSFVHEGITLNSQLVSHTSPLHCFVMAISSSSSSSYSSYYYYYSSSFQRGYDVFLSFRGEDTRNNFTAHLYKELHTKGVKICRIAKENRGENRGTLKRVLKQKFSLHSDEIKVYR